MNRENKVMVTTCIITIVVLWVLSFMGRYYENQKVQACVEQTGNPEHTIISGDLYCRTDAGHWVKNKEFK